MREEGLHNTVAQYLNAAPCQFAMADLMAAGTLSVFQGLAHLLCCAAELQGSDEPGAGGLRHPGCSWRNSCFTAWCRPGERWLRR